MVDITSEENKDIIAAVLREDYITAASIFSEGERTISDEIFIKMYNNLPTTYTENDYTYNPKERLVTDSLIAGVTKYVDIGMSLGYTIPKYWIDTIKTEFDYERGQKKRRDEVKCSMYLIPYQYLVSKGYISDIPLDNTYETQHSNKLRRISADIQMVD